MHLHSRFGRDFLPALKRSVGAVNLVLGVLFASANCFAQQPEAPHVLRVQNALSSETTFSRPRRVNAAIANYESARLSSFSLQEATTFERIAFELTNEARIANGLQPLNWDAELCRLARRHSEDMARRGYFDHETPEGLLPRERARAVGYRFRVIAENIAYNKGYDDPAGLAVSRWMKSSGHRANILFNQFQYSAIGSYVGSDGTVYLTQVFTSR